jgi:WD40 repeat protein
MQVINHKTLDKQVTFVKCFQELPDVIFTAAFNPENNLTYLWIMSTTSDFVAMNDPHAGPITDIHFLTINNQRILITGSEDGKIRAFSYNQDNTILKQLEHPVTQGFVTKFLAASEQILICSLSSGKFLIWNLAANSFDEMAGHSQ